MLSSKCVVSGRKSSRLFRKELEPRLLLYSLGIKTPLSKIPLLDKILFNCADAIMTY